MIDFVCVNVRIITCNNPIGLTVFPLLKSGKLFSVDMSRICVLKICTTKDTICYSLCHQTVRSLTMIAVNLKKETYPSTYSNTLRIVIIIKYTLHCIYYDSLRDKNALLWEQLNTFKNGYILSWQFLLWFTNNFSKRSTWMVTIMYDFAMDNDTDKRHAYASFFK